MNITRLSAVGLVLLGLLAAALSFAALFQHRAVQAEPAPTPTSQGPATPSAPKSSPVAEFTTPAETVEPAPVESTTIEAGPVVVVIGDSYSMEEPGGTWIGEVATALGWGEVVNLSAPGRGYMQAPRSCGFSVCANFRGSIPLVLEHHPDIVITFGGTADGDYSLERPAADYFDALRDALPEAEIIAISPVTTDNEAPYWLTLHRRTISAGVGAVGGVMVDVGQPGAGDGEALSSESQHKIAEAIIDQLGDA